LNRYDYTLTFSHEISTLALGDISFDLSELTSEEESGTFLATVNSPTLEEPISKDLVVVSMHSDCGKQFVDYSSEFVVLLD